GTPPVAFAVLVPALPPLTFIVTVCPAKSQGRPIVPLIVPPGAVLPRFVTAPQPGGTYPVVVVCANAGAAKAVKNKPSTAPIIPRLIAKLPACSREGP